MSGQEWGSGVEAHLEDRQEGGVVDLVAEAGLMTIRLVIIIVIPMMIPSIPPLTITTTTSHVHPGAPHRAAAGLAAEVPAPSSSPSLPSLVFPTLFFSCCSKFLGL